MHVPHLAVHWQQQRPLTWFSWIAGLSGGVGGISCWQGLGGTPEVISAQLRTAGQRGSHIKIEEGDRNKGMGCRMRLVGTFSP